MCQYPFFGLVTRVKVNCKNKKCSSLEKLSWNQETLWMIDCKSWFDGILWRNFYPDHTAVIFLYVPLENYFMKSILQWNSLVKKLFSRKSFKKLWYKNFVNSTMCRSDEHTALSCVNYCTYFTATVLAKLPSNQRFSKELYFKLIWRKNFAWQIFSRFLHCDERIQDSFGHFLCENDIFVKSICFMKHDFTEFLSKNSKRVKSRNFHQP